MPMASRAFAVRGTWPHPPIMRIALLDADLPQARRIAKALALADHSCGLFNACLPLLRALQRDGFDALIAACVSEADARALLASTRALQPALPVILMLARARHLVGCLHAGADDCIIQPVRADELLARTDALLRRVGLGRSRADKIETFDGYAFDATRLQVVANDGAAVQLTPKEFRFALLLFRNRSRPVSREHILAAVWGRDTRKPSRTVDTHASRLRVKLRLSPERGYRLLPLYGHGYCLEFVPAPRHALAYLGPHCAL
jgi:DNA-binding response OmpR family regulator